MSITTHTRRPRHGRTLRVLGQSTPTWAPAPMPTAPSRRGRTLHLRDDENLTEGQITAHNLITLQQTYESQIGIADGDQVRIGCHPYTAATIAFAVPTGRQLLVGAYGPDSADHALIDSVDVDFTARRFDTVIIGSGDHIFAPLATALVAAGCRVIAVARHHSSISARLRLATHTQHILTYTLKTC